MINIDVESVLKKSKFHYNEKECWVVSGDPSIKILGFANFGKGSQISYVFDIDGKIRGLTARMSHIICEDGKRVIRNGSITKECINWKNVTLRGSTWTKHGDRSDLRIESEKCEDDADKIELAGIAIDFLRTYIRTGYPVAQIEFHPSENIHPYLIEVPVDAR